MRFTWSAGSITILDVYILEPADDDEPAPEPGTSADTTIGPPARIGFDCDLDGYDTE